MPWKECHVMDERVRFVARLLDGEKMAPLCAEFGISRNTGYKVSASRRSSQDRGAVSQKRGRTRTSGTARSGSHSSRRRTPARPRHARVDIERCVRRDRRCASPTSPQRRWLRRRNGARDRSRCAECRRTASRRRASLHRVARFAPAEYVANSAGCTKTRRTLRKFRRGDCDWESRKCEVWRSDFARFAGFVETAFA